MKQIDILVPVYNEQEGIAAFHAALRGTLDAVPESRPHIIYVLDGCTDGSAQILGQICERENDVSLLLLARRFGHQMSLVAGMDHSSGDAVIMMDSDLQHPPALIPELLSRFAAGSDIVHTIRTYDGRVGRRKRLSSALYYWLLNLISPVKIPAGTSDFRLVSRRVVEVFQQSVREQQQFLRGLFQWAGFQTSYLPFVAPPRQHGSTKFGWRQMFSFSLSGLTSFSRGPLRLASLLGLAGSGLILPVLALSYWQPVLGREAFGHTGILMAILFVCCLQLFVSAAIAEYLGRIFDEVKKRPLYIIAAVKGRLACEQTHRG